MPPTIRRARRDDGAALRDIERRAGARFREVGMPEIADDEPPAIEVLDAYAVAGCSWVAVDAGDRPLGYVLVDVVDGCAHVEQVTVDPDRQGAGIGRGLLDHVRDWASDQGLQAVTLTTFRDVPWNAPLYEHLGFRIMDAHEVGPELQAIVDREAAHGLDPAARVCMRSGLDRPGA